MCTDVSQHGPQTVRSRTPSVRDKRAGFMWQGRCAKHAWTFSVQTNSSKQRAQAVCASQACGLSVQAKCCKRSVGC
eukprot:11126304-Alexandrium_andersonii.AAC.1